jgi:hypothetical protein
LAEVFGLRLPELSNDYTNALNVRETARLFERHIPVLLADRQEQPEEGTLALIRERGHLCHLGMYAGGGYILHTAVKTGSVCQRAGSPGLRGRIEGYYRVR